MKMFGLADQLWIFIDIDSCTISRIFKLCHFQSYCQKGI